jgi:Putative beta-lactamase-inhibitor-like, PepSY-like
MPFPGSLNGAFAATAVWLSLITAALANQEKIPLDKVPKAVLEAVKAKFPKGELTGAEKETDGEKVTFEVKLLDNKRKFEVIANPDGKILAVEKVLEPSELPKAVTAALDAKYPKARIKKAEEVTADEKISYEVVLITAETETVKVIFDPEGKLVESKS